MRRIRVIPTLLLDQGRLVKTRRFKAPVYVGDPVNTVKILNDKRVDELILLDITASSRGAEPDLTLIEQIAGECFMPLAYGGGIATLEQARAIFSAGVEKVVINSTFHSNPELVRELADIYGEQAVVISIDARQPMLARSRRVYTHGGARTVKSTPIAAARAAVAAGGEEIMICAMDQDGEMTGYDLELVRSAAEAVPVPVIASGGAGSLQDFARAAGEAGASAVAAGAMFVFKGPHRAILVNYPSQDALRAEVFSALF